MEEPYRRDIKGIRNLQESRHALAGKIFHGRKGEVYQRYYKGMEDQLGALGLVLNCVTLWNTFYIDQALARLRAAGYLLAEEDVARLSPFGRRHINVIGTYTFTLPDLGPGGMRDHQRMVREALRRRRAERGSPRIDRVTEQQQKERLADTGRSFARGECQ